MLFFSVLIIDTNDFDVSALDELDSKNDITITDSNFIIQEYVSGLKLPVMIDFINDVMFIIEKNGSVRIVEDGILHPEPVLQLNVSTTIEEGLIGILSKGNQVYLHYTTKNLDNNTTSNRFAEYSWNNKKLILSKELSSFHNGNGMHNSGVMIEDQNGNILAGIGDLGYKPHGFKNSLNGEEYNSGSIFFLNSPEHVYAKGIRNTFGMDFVPITGILWNTENGPDSFDELNLVEERFNSGWNFLQGPRNDHKTIPEITGFTYSDPEFSWERSIGVTAIHFVTSPMFQNYDDSVLAGSFHDGILYSFDLNKNRTGFVFESNDLTDNVLNKTDNPHEIILGSGFSGITDIKEGLMD